ncbi:MAG: DsbA family protein [Pseudomonadota bacterium]
MDAASNETAARAPSDASTHHLVYVGDPMCSWCWGFAPVLTRLLETFGARLLTHVVVGGLRAFNTRAMDAEQKSTIRGHWEHVAERTGQPFDYAFFERDGFVYDTEPACRAVVTARLIDPRLTFAMMHAVHRAFYVEGADTRSASALRAASEQVGIDGAAFDATFGAEATKAQTMADFQTAQQAGITGFPTLLLGDNAGEFHVLSAGYQAYEPLAERLAELIDTPSTADSMLPH